MGNDFCPGNELVLGFLLIVCDFPAYQSWQFEIVFLPVLLDKSYLMDMSEIDSTRKSVLSCFSIRKTAYDNRIGLLYNASSVGTENPLEKYKIKLH